MRLLSLTLCGFRSYPGLVIVDFTGKNLVAALGDTGAGKSSLLDAIAYALFRKSSWDAREPRQLIADGATAMSVELEFLLDGQRWRVHRTMHASNPNAGRHSLTNLDTGEQVDNATPVDDRIKSVLQMGYETFLRVGLLPQGKFDQLLTASVKDRTPRLRELFGAEALETIQKQADARSRTIKDLLHEARIKRSSMPSDPACVAAEARAAAEAAEMTARRLTESIEAMKTLQSQARDAAATRDAARQAAELLTARTVADAEAVLDQLEPVAATLEANTKTLENRAADTDAEIGKLTAIIASADESGDSLPVLHKAASVLETLPRRAAELRQEGEQLATAKERIAAEARQIADAEEDLARRGTQSAPLIESAALATMAADNLRARASAVRSAVVAAADAAAAVAATAKKKADAAVRLDTARGAIDQLDQAAADADGQAAAADAELRALEARNRAAAIAADLHLGDDCPVCQQIVPDDFEPLNATDDQAIKQAASAARAARRAQTAADEKLMQACAAVNAAEATVGERDAEHRTAEETAQRFADQAITAIEDVAAADETTPGTCFDTEHATAALATALEALRRGLPAGSAVTDTAAVNGPVIACEEAATRHAEQLRSQADQHAAALKADRKALAARKTAHEQQHEHAQKDQTRHATAVKQLATDVHALPQSAQRMLPQDATATTEAAAAPALADVNAGISRLQQLDVDLSAAHKAAADIAKQQRALGTQAALKLNRPLSQLRERLTLWAQAAGQATAHLEPDATGRHAVPPTPAEPDIAATRTYAVALAGTATGLTTALDSAVARNSERIDAAVASLATRVHSLGNIEGLDATADLTDANALLPIASAVGQVKTEAAGQRQKERVARAQIQPAADLDFAIAAGETRAEALEVLRRELVDAKFLGHLTALRTRALLGVASDLLGQLSDNQFGFADTFEIISRGSGVEHSPQRLSGGEKFLASLALALALAELHSRSGPRLSSLFLDEGFAALDAGALDSALSVLRAQAGGDRLVMVISHLHAVAEAVDDVLWVEKSASGSAARWLSAAERDDLVRADMAAGLQTLT